MKLKIQITSWLNGSVLFEYESENNTIRKTLQAAIETRADLTRANLRGADLRDANLRDANLTGADLRGANLEPIKNDFFIVLLHGIKEIGFLKQAIIDGKIDSSTYEGNGECYCLSGTLYTGAVKQDGPQEAERVDIIKSCRKAERPAERFFLGIKPGNTPENNQASKLVLEWILEFERLIA